MGSALLMEASNRKRERLLWRKLEKPPNGGFLMRDKEG